MAKASLRDDEVSAVLQHLNRETFTTEDFLGALRRHRRSAWSRLVAAYGEGGEGAGKAYTASSSAAHALKRFANQGRLERVKFVGSPKDWGSPAIAVWRINHSPPRASSPGLQNLTASSVLLAIDEYERLGQLVFLKKYDVSKSRSYYLIHKGRRYDSKAIAAAAHGYAAPKLGPLNRRHFSGGAATVQRRLQELGFALDVSGSSINKIECDEADTAPFNPNSEEDARSRIKTAIVQRRGQARFRASLIKSYNGRCAVSGCGIRDVLEAAHIRPYLGPHTNHVCNGLLLRADLHTLFDCGLIGVDANHMKVLVSPTLLKSEYGKLHGARLRLPEKTHAHPDKRALERHREEAGL